MGLVYLFSLVVALGVLGVQIALGGKGDGDAGADHGDASGTNDVHHLGHGSSKALAKDVASGDNELALVGDTLAFFFSLRFWIFAMLAFGLTGSLLSLFSLAGAIGTFLLAISMGLGSGLFASLAFRYVARSSASSTADVTHASGSIGRVLVPLGKGKVGQIRIVMKGQSVDLMARTDEAELLRGEHVLVEEVEDGIARVSKRPSELA